MRSTYVFHVRWVSLQHNSLSLLVGEQRQESIHRSPQGLLVAFEPKVLRSYMQQATGSYICTLLYIYFDRLTTSEVVLISLAPCDLVLQYIML